MSSGCLQAYWLDRCTLALPPDRLRSEWTYFLAASDGCTAPIQLELTGNGLSGSLQSKFPRIQHYKALHLSDTIQTASVLRGGPRLRSLDENRSVVYETGVQVAGVLDDLYAYDGPLGVNVEESTISVRLWAPTARSVQLLLFKGSSDREASARLAMQERQGVWTCSLEAHWQDAYYLFNVEVYVPSSQTFDYIVVSDPYSIDIALNGSKSRLTNLASDRRKPEGWDRGDTLLHCPWSKLSIYELHVRDFSISDDSVRPEYRGNYLAFTEPDSRGIRHLRGLAEAGLKVVHLLPTFHFASVDEDKRTWQDPGDLSSLPPDSSEQQARIGAVQQRDGFNWGYDPVHYLAPQGSYATNPDDRVLEYRHMVQSLHRLGLRVVQDLVFNHTFASGNIENSVLDRVVPGYYYRLDLDGKPHTTSCCPDTATEHRMMEKLMVDAIVHHARFYRIDGFRFDLMSFHLLSNLQNVRSALNELTVEKDGVDGRAIYLYGEGWNFGETANNQLGINAAQWNLQGTGIGSFNDRMRDGVRGGSPFTDLRTQGFATGLFTDSNDYTQGTQSSEEQRLELLAYSDIVRISLAGNLRNYRMYNRWARNVAGCEIEYNGGGAAYAATPYETINFCSVHDNQCLFDAIQIKSSSRTPIGERARRQVLALSLLALGQGIPFFHAGDDLLRSKSLDGNSFNSGDWFNRIDWSAQSSNWGAGLPMASEHQQHWAMMAPLLRDAPLRPTEREIRATRDAFREFLRIRYSSDLFGLGTLEEVQQNVRFLNWGPDQIPGLIAMSLGEVGGSYGAYRRIVVFFNANRDARQFWDTSFVGEKWELHPVQQESSDLLLRTAQMDQNYLVSIPALTTSVFVVRTS